SAILWKPPAHSPEENMVRQKCSGIRRSYLASAVPPNNIGQPLAKPSFFNPNRIKSELPTALGALSRMTYFLIGIVRSLYAGWYKKEVVNRFVAAFYSHSTIAMTLEKATHT
ncbi:hypothetical protein, partial [Serratia nevei]|uniref:hypothetical protein n=1 Tax=Serratia nevei TaxID=2703794 RepID=UPI00255137F6